MSGPQRNGGHPERTGLFVGLILILVGGYFLVRNYLPSIDAERLWPILLVIVGAFLLAASVRRNDTAHPPVDRAIADAAPSSQQPNTPAIPPPPTMSVVTPAPPPTERED